MRVRPVGARAVLVEVADALAATSLAAWARDRVGADEVVPAARSVLLDGVDPERVADLLAGWAPGSGRAPGREVVVPVTYDGDDLAAVAAHWGCTVAEVVERHTGTAWVSAFCGFAPGFAYLAGMREAWAVPRLESPRARVPAGSVALADTWCGVYPTSSPGGWLLIGRTAAPLWDLSLDPPALLAPGTRVRFEAVS